MNDSRRRLLFAFISACGLSAVYYLGSPGCRPRVPVWRRESCRESAGRHHRRRRELRRIGAAGGAAPPGRRRGRRNWYPEPGEMEEIEPIGAAPANSAPVNRSSPSVASPSPAISYEGEVDQALGGGTVGFYKIPPDTMGAVGPDSVNKAFVTVNNNYKIQNKSTGAQLSLVSIAAFWASTGAKSPFDPRVQVHPYNNRWLLAAVTEAYSATTSILIGISHTSDPSGWYTLIQIPARIGGDPAAVDLADFPMLGFNKNWVVVTINMFAAHFLETRMLVVNYPTLRGGTWSASYVPGIGVFSLHPATTYSATEEMQPRRPSLQSQRNIWAQQDYRHRGFSDLHARRDQDATRRWLTDRAGTGTSCRRQWARVRRHR